ncbi:MAG: uroporphyrinogen-III synthase [Acidobacteria bacterium]|nr:uroporphyrinogen-III synthase [Acidobacteriota bacterium]
MAFDGHRVLALESRRANEIAALIRNQGGDPFVAPSMREAPLEENAAAFDFAEKLFAGRFDMMILLTGVGTRALNKLLASRYEEGRFADALRKITTVARGPKPVAALREMSVPVTVTVPEPNTWRELLAAIDGRTEKRIAVQEYGRSNTDLLDALSARGAEVTPVRVYQWALPEDTRPLREAARTLAAGGFDFALFTTSIQAPHLLEIAAEEGVEAEVLGQLRTRVVVASIGPTCSEMLDEHGIPTDIAPTHPKMGFLVKETAEQAEALLGRKRG